MKNQPVIPIEQAWEKWKDCLEGKDRNSIYYQVCLLVWDAGIYRLLLESRQILVNRDPEKNRINGALHSFFDRNFFHSQATSIRRLTDQAYPLVGKKSVFSLISLIDNIASYRSELTRSKFLELSNIPYDIESLRKKEDAFIRKNAKNNLGFFTIPNELLPERSIEAHSLFDRLSLVNPQDRQPSDLVSVDFWNNLKDKINKNNQINAFVNKFIAHASSPESRALDNYEHSTITLNQLWDIHRILCEVMDFLAVLILNTKLILLLLEPSEFFKYWDTPLADAQSIDFLKTAFNKYRQETEEWNYSKLFSR